MTSTRSLRPALPDQVNLYRRPGLFYGLAVAIPWSLWLLAGQLSRRPEQSSALHWGTMALAVAGLLAPVAIAWLMVRRNTVLRNDVLHRLANFREVPPLLGVASLVLLPASLLAATALSLPLGYSAGQFAPRTSTAMRGGWAVLLLAPVLEELAWHSYGTDALASHWTVWRSTIVFAISWAAWHLPLAGIKGSYQADVVETSMLAGVNFFASVFPLMILMNWLYYRCGRNIWVPVAVHLSANLGNEIFWTHPDTKVIQRPCCSRCAAGCCGTTGSCSSPGRRPGTLSSGSTAGS